MKTRKRIIGIDFSGARDACKKIWLAEGSIKDRTLVFDRCSRARDLFDPGNDRTECYRVLRNYLTSRGDVVVGLDFPFGLPAEIVVQARWEDFLSEFSRRFDSPDAFRHRCRKAGSKELKRETDLLSRTPFSPYNLRIYKQTYYGITQILEPLVRTNHAVALPMQPPRPQVPWLVEICPASTLKNLDLYIPYKGNDRDHTAARREILDGICKTGLLRINGGGIREAVIQDNNGDALDSLIAAAATFKAYQDIDSGRLPTVKDVVEGWVYA